ncbi:hypothetical protein [uncultured Maribacter sp.]|uniref:hypothetical protein n=1 Tax=uncultured Maribacter sp. TaxID=431308 RepID=UPI0026328308|nr:hypothetical protein [uncultured Maribacter sp.]
MKKIEDFFINTIKAYPIYSGISLLIIGILLVAYQIRKNESFNMNEHGLGSWKTFVGIWGIAIFSILWGVILIVRNY